MGKLSGKAVEGERETGKLGLKSLVLKRGGDDQYKIKRNLLTAASMQKQNF